MTNKLFVIVNSLKVPKITNILLYEMKFLVPNYSCLQNPWLGDYRPQIPVLCPQVNLFIPLNKIPGYATGLEYRLSRDVCRLRKVPGECRSEIATFIVTTLEAILDYADDVCLLAKRFCNMEEKLKRLKEETELVDLHININKTKGVRVNNLICKKFVYVIYWAGHVGRMGEESRVYRVLLGKPEGRKPLGRPRRRWVDNIRLDLREVGCGYMDWIGLAQDRDKWRTLVSAVMNLRVP